MKLHEGIEELQKKYPEYIILVNGIIICRKMAKKNVVFPTYFLWSYSMIQYNYVNHRR